MTLLSVVGKTSELHDDDDMELDQLVRRSHEQGQMVPSFGNQVLPKDEGIHLAICFALLNTGVNMFHEPFASYHMNMYLTFYKVSAPTMASVHSVFALWNPLNDLIGAWVSDNWAAKHGGSRIRLILAQIFVWPISCVLPFWPIAVAWLGAFWLALLALSVEDTFFSCVMIAMGGMWTDITRGEAERVKINRLEKVFAFLATPLVSVHYRMWTRAQSLGDVTEFAYYCSGLALTGVALSFVALRKLARIEQAGLSQHSPTPSKDAMGKGGKLKMLNLLKSLLAQRNLWCFIAMNALNEVQFVFNNEFAAIFADINLRGAIGEVSRSMYFSFQQTCVFVSTMLLSVVAQERGVYIVYVSTTLTKLLTGMVLLLIPHDGYLGAAYHLLSITCTSSSLAFFVVAMGNLRDEYRYRQGDIPTAPIAGLFWGLHALIAKPLNSIGPVIGTQVLEEAGWTGEAMRGPVTEAARAAGYRLIIGFPIVCCLLQLLALYYYDLHSEKLKRIQEMLH